MEGNKIKIIEKTIRNVSHELKNPLTTIKGYVELLYSSLNVDDTYEKSLSKILKQIEKIDSMLELLVEINSVKKPECAQFDANKILNDFCDRASLLLNKEIKINSTNIPSLRGEEKLFNRILELIVLEFSWDNYPEAEAAIQYSANKVDPELEIIINKCPLNNVKDNDLFMPFTLKHYYKNGTELYEALVISDRLNWDIASEIVDGSLIFRITF